LIFKDSTKASSFFRGAQDKCEDLYVLVGASPKRIKLFEDVQKENEATHVKRLRNLSRTRWTTRGPAAKLILEKYPHIVSTVELLMTDPSSCNAESKPGVEMLQ
jgi:hypothetical protein